MRRALYILTILSLFGFSFKNRNTGRLTGTIANCKDSTVLYLVNLDSLNTVDSLIVVNGTFTHNLQLAHPTKFLLHNKRNQYGFRDRKLIWLEPSDISLNGNYQFLEKLQVKGSVSNMEFEEYNQLLNGAFKSISNLEEQIHLKSEGEKVAEKIKLDSLKKDLGKKIESFMIEHKNSYVTLSNLHSECYNASRNLTKEQIQTIYNTFSKEFHSTVKGVEIKDYLKLPEPPKIGDLAPEIIQTTPSGDTIRLSDFKGRYVLLDFWSSSCAPCRGEFKWLRKVHKKFSPTGLVILGVSGDNNKQKWVNAIQHDSISWMNISDLKGSKNEAFLLYDIKIIPNKFLIDPNGRIIHDRMGLNSEYSTIRILDEIFEKKNAE